MRVPPDLPMPSLANHSPPLAMMSGTFISVSTLLTMVASWNRPLHRRERRLEPRPAALALERVEQRRLLAADVRAGAAVQREVELEHAVGRPGGPCRGSRAS